MNLWEKFELTQNPGITNQGIFFHYQPGIDPELKRRFLNFSRWIRRNYLFPVRLNVYVLNCEKVKLRNGAMVYGTFRWYPKRPPNIQIPSAVEPEVKEELPMEEIYDAVLSSLVHELTHYFQWASGAKQSNAISERQANYYRFRIIDQFDMRK